MAQPASANRPPPRAEKVDPRHRHRGSARSARRTRRVERTRRGALLNDWTECDGLDCALGVGNTTRDLDPWLAQALVPSRTRRGRIPGYYYDDDENDDDAMTPEEVFAGARTSIDKYMALRKLLGTDPDEYYRLLVNATEDVLPFIYTPTVGEACQKYSNLGIETTGLYLSLEDRGSILRKLEAWPNQNIKAIVVTDGERILGLGDLGAGGMGISEGKIQLYTAAAGVAPESCLPICLDVGTNRDSLLADPAYRGLRQKRATGIAYYSFLDEFVSVLKAWQTHVLLQFEDFGNHTAFNLLGKYRNQVCCFNDDIQGTATITLAGILAGLRVRDQGKAESDQRSTLANETILFHGAGEAGVGCGELIALALATWHGIPLPEARKKILFMDSKGLVCKTRLGRLQEHKIPFAHDLEYAKDLEHVVRMHKPTVLVGVSTQRGAFTDGVIKEMCAISERPIIFPLSNPTSKSECTFEEAFAASEGKVIFASGSPFRPLVAQDTGKTVYPAQANNAYIFPAVGHAAILCQASGIPEEVFLEAAASLAHQSTEEDLAMGRLFPPFSDIREVSNEIMARLCQYFCQHGYGQLPKDLKDNSLESWTAYTQSKMYQVPSKL